MINGVSTIPLPGLQLGSLRAAGAAGEESIAPVEFVVGPENRLAAVAVGSLLEGRGQVYSPLLIYGPSGSGKSHLARGLAGWWREHNPQDTVQVLGGADWAREYAQALDRESLADWRAGIRSCSLLVIEDLGQLAGKGAAQLELLHTVDELAARDAMLVVTARSLPEQMPSLAAGLRSRLSAGLTVPLALPGSAARRTILERLASSRGLALPKSALRSLSAGPSVPAAALFGAIQQMELAARGDVIGGDELRRLAAEHPPAEPPTLREIAKATAKYFGLKLADLKSPSRRQAVVAARGVAIYLTRLLTPGSLEQIGDFFGGRDHTTVLHGQRRTERLLKRDPATRHAVSEVRKTLMA